MNRVISFSELEPSGDLTERLKLKTKELVHLDREIGEHEAAGKPAGTLRLKRAYAAQSCDELRRELGRRSVPLSMTGTRPGR